MRVLIYRDRDSFLSPKNGGMVMEVSKIGYNFAPNNFRNSGLAFKSSSFQSNEMPLEVTGIDQPDEFKKKSSGSSVVNMVGNIGVVSGLFLGITSFFADSKGAGVKRALTSAGIIATSMLIKAFSGVYKKDSKL